MAEITQVNGRPVIDYMARDYQSLLQAMYDLIPNKLPEWKDYANQADFGNVLLQLFAHMGDILSYYQDRVANESFLGTAQTRRSIIEHLRLIGYKLATAAPAAAGLAVTVPGTFTGTITISKGDAFATKSQKTKPSVRFEYTGDDPVILDFSSPDVATFPQPGVNTYVWRDPDTGAKTLVCLDPKTGKPRLDPDTGKPLGCLPVEEGRLVKDEILGTSDGTANQRFTLAHSGVILRSLGQATQINKDIILTTVPPGVDPVWNLQESLAFSRELQQDFVIEVDEDDQATVIFGDGAFGAKPANGATIKATYRVGGGLAGNVPANSIQTIVNAPQLALIGAKVTNPAPATGGAERESIEHAVQHAPAVFRSLKRAVTAEDYRALALRYKGVGKVRAEPTNWNTVTLFVAPDGGGQVSDVLEANLLAYFEDKRMLSQIIEVEDVDYVSIYVTAEIGVQSYYSQADVQARVQEAAAGLLAFAEVDFGQIVYLSKFYEKIESIEGILYVNITEFRRSGAAANTIEREGKIKLGDNEIPRVPLDPEYALGLKIAQIEGGF